MQSRYYDPALSRFINADNYPTTGQGLLCNNMFVYCCNNPVNYADNTGTVGTLAAVCGIAAVISGISNAISTACTGGSVKECLIAGLCGAVGGAVGAVVGVALPIDPLRKSIIGRGLATVITDIGTSWALNGKITTADVVWTAFDATMDMTFSTISYFYNPVEDLIKQTAINGVIDAGADVGQILLFSNNTTESSEKTATTKRDSAYQYAHAKVGRLLGVT